MSRTPGLLDIRENVKDRDPTPMRTPYRYAVLADKPIGYWRLDEASGTNAADSSGNGNVGTYTTSPTLSVPGALAPYDNNRAVQLAGGSYVLYGNPAAFQGTTFTLECWIKTRFAISYSYGWHSIFTKEATCGMYIMDTGEVTMYDWGGGSGFPGGQRHTGYYLNDNLWHHMVATWQNGVVGGTLLYIDGVLAYTTTVTVSNTTYPLRLGFDSTTTQYFIGSMDEAAFYNYVLPPARVLAHFQAGGIVRPGYRDTILNDAPVGYWRLGETGATATDLGSSANNGTYVGTLSQNQPSALDSDANGSVTYTGAAGTWIDVPDIAAYGSTTALSAECWFKSTSISSASFMNRRNVSNIGGFTFEPGGGGRINMFIYINGGTWNSAISNRGVFDGLWHHIVGTYDGTVVCVYIDGTLEGSLPLTGAISNPASALFRIGYNVGGSLFYTGSLDEAAYYTYALTGAQVQAHFNAAQFVGGYTSQVMRDSPTAWWRLGEPSSGGGTTANDSSGNGKNGTYTIGSGGLSNNGPLVLDRNTALFLDGSSTMVVCPPFNSPTFTAECWFRSNNTQVTGLPCIISDVYPDAINFCITFDGPTLNIYGGSYLPGFWYQTNRYTLLPLTWYHLAVSYDGSVMRLFVNGNERGRYVCSITPRSPGTNTRIGRRWDLTDYAAGIVDEVAIYPVALSRARLRQHFYAGSLLRCPAPSWVDTIRSDNPVGWWRFGEASGTVCADSSNNANNGTYTGAITLNQASGVFADADPSITLPGGGPCITVADIAAYGLNTQGYTLECWMKLPNGTSSAGTITERRRTDNTGGWILFINVNKASMWTHTNTWYNLTGVALVNDGLWHHIVSTWDGTTQRLYVDGVQDASTVPAVGGQVNNPASPVFRICNNSGSATDTFNGSLDELVIYSFCMTPTRIQQHYQVGSGKYPL